MCLALQAWLATWLKARAALHGQRTVSNSPSRPQATAPRTAKNLFGSSELTLRMTAELRKGWGSIGQMRVKVVVAGDSKIAGAQNPHPRSGAKHIMMLKSTFNAGVHVDMQAIILRQDQQLQTQNMHVLQWHVLSN